MNNDNIDESSVSHDEFIKLIEKCDRQNAELEKLLGERFPTPLEIMTWDDGNEFEDAILYKPRAQIEKPGILNFLISCPLLFYFVCYCFVPVALALTLALSHRVVTGTFLIGEQFIFFSILSCIITLSFMHRIIIYFTSFRSILGVALYLRRFTSMQGSWSNSIRSAVGAYFYCRAAYSPNDEVLQDFPNIRDKEVTGPLKKYLGGSSDDFSLIGHDWKGRVIELLQASDVCVIDVTEISDSVAWEIMTALRILPAHKVILVSHCGHYFEWRENHLKVIEQQIRHYVSSCEEEIKQLHSNVLTVPIYYGPNIFKLLLAVQLFGRVKKIYEIDSEK